MKKIGSSPVNMPAVSVSLVTGDGFFGKGVTVSLIMVGILATMSEKSMLWVLEIDSIMNGGFSTDGFFYEGDYLFFFDGGYFFEAEGSRPHGAVVEVGRIVEAQGGVSGAEFDCALS